MTWEAGWRYGIISTVPYEQQKIYRQIILFQRIYYLSISLTGLPCHREPSIVLMSMPEDTFSPIKKKMIIMTRIGKKWVGPLIHILNSILEVVN